MDIPRTILPTLVAELDKPFVSVLMGTRQVGKSWLLRKLLDLSRKNEVPASLFDLEDPLTLRKFNNDDAGIIELLAGAGKLVFIDEFQYAKNATHIFKAIYDRGNGPKIVVSGSSSIEMHRHLKESLAGRYRISRIGPLSWMDEASTVPGSSFLDYLRFGGLPGLVNEAGDNDKMQFLQDIIQSYLLKDVRGLLKEENVRAFNSLLYLIAENQGSTLTVASLAREVRLSEPTVRCHLDILEQTYVAFALDSFSTDLGNELKKSKKYYLYDQGIRNVLLRDFSTIETRTDKGAIAETFVFLALKRKLKPNMEIRFWRTKAGNEVDFIILENRIPTPVEVKYQLGSPEIPASMKAFFKTYPSVPEGWVYSSDLIAEANFEDRIVHFRPLEQVERFPQLD